MTQKIGGNECEIVDRWKNGTEVYTIGSVLEFKEWYCARVITSDKEWAGQYIYEFDTKPTRELVEETYLNDISARAIDKYEAEYGADGTRAFPGIQAEKENYLWFENEADAKAFCESVAGAEIEKGIEALPGYFVRYTEMQKGTKIQYCGTEIIKEDEGLYVIEDPDSKIKEFYNNFSGAACEIDGRVNSRLH